MGQDGYPISWPVPRHPLDTEAYGQDHHIKCLFHSPSGFIRIADEEVAGLLDRKIWVILDLMKRTPASSSARL